MRTKSAGRLPSNELEWGGHIIAELTGRLPDIKSFISDYRTLVNNNKGTAIGLVTLQGSRAFIPVIIREWKLQPMDLIIAKIGKELNYRFLSKRAILDLLVTSSLGRPVARPGAGGVGDVYLNVFSPVGGTNSYSSNPFQGMSMSNMKSASYFRQLHEVIKSKDLMKYASEELAEISTPLEQPETKPSYILLSKAASGKYELFSKDHSEGVEVPEKDVANILASLDVEERIEKAASLERDMYSIIGSFYPRKGNVLLKFERQDARPGTHPDRVMPAHEGVFMVDDGPIYINPRVRYLNWEPCNYGLGVGLGYFTLSKEFPDFTANPAGESSLPSKEELIVQARDTQIGKKYAILDEKNQIISVPFELVSKTIDEKGNVAFQARQVFGPTGVVTVCFVDGLEEPVTNSDYMVYYPSFHSRVICIPDEYKEKINTEGTNHFDGYINVKVKGDGVTFTFIEDGRHTSTMTQRQAVFKLMHRYGFSLEQALNFLKEVPMQLEMSFMVRNILSDRSVVASLNEKAQPDMEEKRGVGKLLDIMGKAASVSESFNKDFGPISLIEKLQSMNNSFSDSITKAANQDSQEQGPQTSDPPNNAPDQRAQQQDAQMNNPSAGLFERLVTISPIEKNTRDVIDLLLYFYSGRLRSNEGNQLITQLYSELKEVESKLGNILLLTQMEQMPEQSYDEIRNLMSDIDNFVTSMASTRVLINA